MVDTKSSTKPKRHTKKKPHPYPNDKTLWAYFMQGMEEPTDTAINEAFPGYHPLWVQHSQRRKVSGEQLKYFRQHLLQITQRQCAAYLRIKLYVLQAWEQGREAVPFMAFELLRVVYESTAFKLSHPDWAGWFIDPKGRLVSPDRGSLFFMPHELSYIRETHRHKTLLLEENEQLKAELAALKRPPETEQTDLARESAKVYQFPAIHRKVVEA